MNILIGYGYHPWGTATYLQRAFERQGTATFVGTSWAAQPGFPATVDLREVVAGLPDKPDLFFLVDTGELRYFPRGLVALDCPTACYLIDVHVRPHELVKKAMFFDYAFSAQRDFVDALRRAGHPQAHWLPFACDPAVHRRYDVTKRYDIGFAGSTRSGYERRRVLLDRLRRRFTVNDHHQSYAPPEMARLYSESRLVFNCSMRREVNMRIFEGPATGTLLLTDRIGNGLSDVVRDGQHVVMYNDDQLVDVAETFLRDDGERTRIAEQGYEHMLTHHTYDHRVVTIVGTVFGQSGGPRLRAPLRHRSEPDVDLAYAEVFSLMGWVDDVMGQYARLPRRLHYRIPAAKQLALCLLRRGHYLLEA